MFYATLRLVSSRKSQSRERVATAWRVLRSYGFRSLSLYFLQWAGVYRCLWIYSHPCARVQAAARIAVEIGELREDELGDYASLVPDCDLDVIRRRMSRGEICTTARLPSGELIGVFWTALGRAWVEFVECEIELDDQAAYLYDQFVSSKHRGVSIAAALESYRQVKLRAQGVHLVIYAVWPENRITLGRIDQLVRPGAETGVLHSYQIFHWHWNRLELYASKYKPLLRLVLNSGAARSELEDPSREAERL